MDGKKKSVDGFLPSSKNAGTFFAQGTEEQSNHAKHGIPSRQLLEGQKKSTPKPEFKAPDPQDLLDLSGIVSLPTRSGHDLKIKVPAEEAIDDEDITEAASYKTKEALEFLDEETEQKPTPATEDDDDTDEDNDLGVDEEDIEEYRSRRAERVQKESRSGFEKNLLARAAVVTVVLALAIGLAYLIFSIFYNAPAPARVEEVQQESSVVNEQPPSAEVTPEPEPPVAPEPEAPATVAVYNAGTTEGAASRLATELTSQGINATVGGNVVYDGAGYTIFDLTGGTKPQAAKQLAELYGATPVVATVADLPSGVQPDVDFVLIIN